MKRSAARWRCGAAWLVGTSDRVRNQVVKMVKALYGDVSAVVHSRTEKKSPNRGQALGEVQDLLRRVLVGLLSLRIATKSEDECFQVLESAATDRSSQMRIASATEDTWRLISPAPQFPNPVWGLQYDPAETS